MQVRYDVDDIYYDIYDLAITAATLLIYSRANFLRKLSVYASLIYRYFIFKGITQFSKCQNSTESVSKEFCFQTIHQVSSKK